MSTKNLDTGNIFRSVYVPTSESLAVTLTGSGTPVMPNVVELSDGTDFITSTVTGLSRALDVAITNMPEITIDHTDDSIAIGTTASLFTGTTVSAAFGLDVNVLNFPAIQPISGTVAATQSGTWNINNISGTISLPTGAATEAKQTQPGIDIGDVTVNNAAGVSAVNIQDGGNSITVDGTISAVQSGTWNINNVSGTVSLPTGAATEVTLATRLADATFTARINTLGQKTMANSTPVVIASDQTVIPVSDNGGSLTVDQATAANLNAQVVGDVASASADSGNPVKMGGKYNATMPSFTDGNRANLQVDKFGELAVRRRNKYLNITGATTTTVKSGAGVLAGIVFGNGTTSMVVTIYDNTTATGTIIARLAPASNAIFATVQAFDLEFSTGLTIVTTISSTDITILYQ